MPRINIPPLTRALLALLLTLSLTNAFLRLSTSSGMSTQYRIPYLTIVPAQSQQYTRLGHPSYYYPWVLVTATLVERNVALLAIGVVAVFFGGRYLERAWGSKELAKFLVILAVVPNTIAWILYATEAILPGLNSSHNICGTLALQAGFLVSFKQLVPEHTVSILKGILRLRVKHFPALHLLLSLLSTILLQTTLPLLLSLLGFLTSWLYLRFYKPTALDTLPLSSSSTTSTMVRGDASETFTLASFFPEPIHTPLAALNDQIWNLAIALRLCSPWSAEDVERGNEQAAARGRNEGMGGLLAANGAGRQGMGSARQEAERRRALALKALDQRLHAASSRGGPAVVQQSQPEAIPQPVGEQSVETKAEEQA